MVASAAADPGATAREQQQRVWERVWGGYAGGVGGCGCGDSGGGGAQQQRVPDHLFRQRRLGFGRTCHDVDDAGRFVSRALRLAGWVLPGDCPPWWRWIAGDRSGRGPGGTGGLVGAGHVREGAWWAVWLAMEIGDGNGIEFRC